MAGREHPLLGIGYRERENYLNQKILIGELKPYVANRHNAHNDYMDALQSRGVPGLILQILIYAILILIYMRGLAGATDEKLFAALAGILVNLSYATYSFTNEPMFAGLTLIFFIVINSLCIGIMKFTKNAISADNSR
jgi:O-antigen ligase